MKKTTRYIFVGQFRAKEGAVQHVCLDTVYFKGKTCSVERALGHFIVTFFIVKQKLENRKSH